MTVLHRRNIKSEILYKTGRKALMNHDPVLAMKSLNDAVKNCTVCNKIMLEKCLYWLAVSLIQLDKKTLAIKALSSAKLLSPHGRAKLLYKRICNEYGMQRSSSKENDDYRAFCAIQVRTYLSATSTKCFCSQEEQEAVLVFIATSWLRVLPSLELNKLSTEEKVKKYRNIKLNFPVMRADFSTSNFIANSSKHKKIVFQDSSVRVSYPFEMKFE